MKKAGKRRIISLILSLFMMTAIFLSPTLAYGEEAAARDLSLIAKVFDYGQDVVAAVIDLGEGKSVSTADLHAEDFAVTAVNTQDGIVRYEGPRTITSVYANSVPMVSGGETKPTEGR